MKHAVWLIALIALPAAALERIESDANLLTMRRVYVERFGGGETADQLRDMVISALQTANLVQITDNPDRADMTMRGSGEDLIYTEDHVSSDNLNIHTNSSSGSRSSAGSSGLSAGENESSRSSERKHEASASVRLVNRDGDIVWSATKESQGGKFRGASADVADKLIRQLVQDRERSRVALAKSASMQAAKPER